jgi:hypothetical protein
MFLNNNVPICPEFQDSDKKKILPTKERRERDVMKTKTQKVLPKTMPGTVHAQYIRCGKPNCKCVRGELHGAYYYHFVRIGGRLRKRYLKASEVEAVKSACLARQERHKREIENNKAAWDKLRDLRQELRNFLNP